MCLRHLDGRYTQFRLGCATQMAIADAKRARKVTDLGARERIFFDSGDCGTDQARDGVNSGQSRRAFRAATQAGSISLGLGGRGAGKEAQILRLRGPRRADRTAVNTGRQHCGEQAPVEAAITGAQGAQAAGGVKDHASRLVPPAGKYSPFSDL